VFVDQNENKNDDTCGPFDLVKIAHGGNADKVFCLDFRAGRDPSKKRVEKLTIRALHR
jgi:hypothetical protein